MAILVTGGAGFIGSHVCEALQKRGEEVIVIDDFNDYYDPAIKEKNAGRVLEYGMARMERGDICDPDFIEGIGWDRVDRVIHLAARAGVRPSIEQPLLYWKTNLEGTLNLIEQVRAHKIKTFVFASSSSVYGNSLQIPFSEEDPVLHPISPYAASKKAGELMMYTYHHLYGINISCLRYFTVYGPRQRPDMAINKFTRLIHAGEKLQMFGDGETRRDYTYIDDIVQGTIGALDNCKGYNIYNLGESDTISLKDLIGLISEALGKEALIDRMPMQPGDVELTNADITKARAEIGYEPKVKIYEGVPRFVEWYLSETAR